MCCRWTACWVATFPSILPDAGISLLKSDRYQMMLISSSYVISSDAVNQQIDELNAILKKYDEGGMLIGEAPCTKDLINCTDRDFKVVSVISIAAIFVIIALVLKSFSLPILLVAMIELAIAPQPVYSVLHGNDASVCRPDPDFDHSARRDGGLRHSDDHAV